MEKIQIIVIILAVALVAFRLYQKYIRKDKSSEGNNRNDSKGNMPGSSATDDDYEPYAKK